MALWEGEVLNFLEGRPQTAHPLRPGQQGASTSAQMDWIGAKVVQAHAQTRATMDAMGLENLKQLWRDSVVKPYLEHNKDRLITETERLKMGPYSQIKHAMQMRPVEIQPETLGAMQQLVTQINQAMLDRHGISFWDFPDKEVHEIAQWINREAGKGRAGFYTVGPQNMSAGVTAGVALMEGAGAVVDPGLNLLYGSYDYGREMLESITGVQLPPPPMNYVEDPQTGELVPDTARPYMGFNDTVMAVRAMAKGEDIMQQINSMHDAMDMNAEQRGFFENGVVISAQLLGSFGLPGKGVAGGLSPFMAGMQGTKRLADKGLAYLGTKQGFKYAPTLLGHAAGPGANAIMMGMAYGRMGDFGDQAKHGFVIGYALEALGALGRGTERLIRTRKKIPKTLTDRLRNTAAPYGGGAAEGIAFTALESATNDKLWTWMKDPTNGNWEEYAASAFVMALTRGAGARGRYKAEAQQERARIEESLTRASRTAVEESMVRESMDRELAPPGQPRPTEELRPEAMEIGKAERAGLPRQASDKARQTLVTEQLGPEGRQEREIDRAIGSERAGQEYKLEPAIPPESTKISIEDVRNKLKGKRGEPISMEVREGRTGRKETRAFVKKTGVGRAKNASEVATLAHEYAHETMAYLARGGVSPEMTARRPGEIQRQYEVVANEFLDKAEYGGVEEARNLLIGPDPDKPHYPTAKKWFATLEKADASAEELFYARGKIASEAFAEVLGRKLLGDALGVKAEAPKLSARIEQIITARENAHILKRLTDVEQTLTTWLGIGARERALRSRPRTKTVEKKAAKLTGGLFARAKRAVRGSWFDEYAAARDEMNAAIRAVQGDPKTLPLAADPYRQIDIWEKTAPHITRTLVEDSAVDIHFNKIGKSLKQVFQEVEQALDTKPDIQSERLGKKFGEGPDVKFQDYRLFLDAVRTLEEYKLGHETVISKAEAMHILQEIQSRIGSEGMVRLKHHANELKKVFGAAIDMIRDAGGMTYEAAERFKSARAVYIPFSRALEDVGAGRVSGQGAKPKTAKGGGGPMVDVYEAAVATLHNYVKMAERARINKSFYELARTGAGQAAELIDFKDVKATVLKGQRILDVLKSKATDEGKALIEQLSRLGLAEQDLTFFTAGGIPFGEKSIVPVTVGDKTHWVALGKEATKAMNRNPLLPLTANQEKWLRVLSGKELTQKAAVTWNPKYALAAFLYDALIRPSTTRGGFAKKLRYGGGILGHMMDFAVGTVKRGIGEKGGTEFVQRLKRAGAFSSTMIAADKLATITEFNVRHQDMSGMRKLAHQVRALSHGADAFLSALGHRVEVAPRIQAAQDVYRKARKAGKSDEVAFQEALETFKEELINFAKGGTMAKLANKFIPFASATFRGQAKFADGLTPKGIAASLANITTPWLISYLLYKDEDWFRDLPLWEKYGSIHINKDTKVRVGYEHAVMYAAIPHMILDSMMEDPQYRPELNQYLGAARDLFLPMARDATSILGPSIRGLVEVGANYEFFRGRQIYPDYLKKHRKPEEQESFNKSGIARAIFSIMPQGFLGIDNPAEVEHLITSLTPGLGTDILHAAENAEEGADLLDYFFLSRIHPTYGHGSAAQTEMEDRMLELSQSGQMKSAEYRRLKQAKNRIGKLWEDKSLDPKARSEMIGEIARGAMNIRSRE